MTCFKRQLSKRVTTFSNFSRAWLLAVICLLGLSQLAMAQSSVSKETLISGLTSVLDIALDANGVLYAIESGNPTIHRKVPGGAVEDITFNAKSLGSAADPKGIAVDENNVVYVVALGQSPQAPDNRIMRLNGSTWEYVVNVGPYLVSPQRLFVKGGKIYVAGLLETSTEQTNLVVYDLATSTLEVVNTTGYKTPTGIVVSSTGTLYAIDYSPSGNNRVIKKEAGASTWSEVDGSTVATTNVWALGIDRNDHLYLGSLHNGQLFKYEGAGWRTILTGSAMPIGVAIADDGIYVAEYQTASVNKYQIPLNQLPKATNDAISVKKGGTATTLTGGATSVLANDSDADGDALTVAVNTSVTNGTLTLNANGTFTYKHNGGESTSDSFTYRLSDGKETVIGTVTITITPHLEITSVTEPNASSGRAASVVYTIAFNKPIASASTSDFGVQTAGAISNVVIKSTEIVDDGMKLLVTVGDYRSAGTFRLRLNSPNSIVDEEGNALTNGLPSMNNIFVDRTAPHIMFGTLGSTDISYGQGPYPTNDNTPTFTGYTTDRGVTITAKINDEVYGTATATQDFTWTMTLDEVPDGAHQIVFSYPVEDLTATATPTVIIDTTPPKATLSMVGDVMRGERATAVTVTFDEPVIGVDTLDFSAPDATILDISGSGSTYTLSVQPNANTKKDDAILTFTPSGVVDALGHLANENATLTYKIDTMPGTQVVTSPSNISDDATGASSYGADLADGLGLSLQEAIYWANSGDEILFDLDPNTAGNQGGTLSLTAPIDITATKLRINGDLNGDGRPDISLDGAHSTRLFTIRTDFIDVQLNGMSLGRGASTAGGVIKAIGDGVLTITNSSVLASSSTSQDGGGALYVEGVDMRLLNTEFIFNWTEGGGGAIYAGVGSSLTIVNSTFENNRAKAGCGGAIEFNGGQTSAYGFRMVGTTVANNLSESCAGGIRLGDASAHLIYNSTIAGNVAATAPAGLSISGFTAIYNTVIAGNHAGPSAALNAREAFAIGGELSDVNSSNLTLYYSALSTSATPVAGTGNLFSLPQADLLFTLLDYRGGLGQSFSTHVGSLLRDAGSEAHMADETLFADMTDVPAEFVEALSVDSTGNTRVVYKVDIGAIEAGSIPQVTGITSPLTHTEGSVATALAGNAAMSDDSHDLSNYGNGDYGGVSVQVVRKGGADATDVFSIVSGPTVEVYGDILYRNNRRVADVDTSTPGQILVQFVTASLWPSKEDVSQVLQQLRYKTVSDTPDASVVLTLTVTNGGGYSIAQDITVNITATNDAPRVNATARSNLTFQNQDAPVNLFTNVSVDTVESDQLITAVSVAVQGHQDGSNEHLIIDGTSVPLVSNTSVTTEANAVEVSITTSGAHLLVSLTKSTGFTTAQTAALLEGLAYQNTKPRLTSGLRYVALADITDNGGGSNTAYINTYTPISVSFVNNAPVISGTPATLANQDAAYAFAATATDLDGDTLTFSINSVPDWALFDPATGTLSGTPGGTHIGIWGPYTISVSDGSASHSLAPFSITVADTQAPTGHSVQFDYSIYNRASASNVAFRFAGAEVGATYSYTVSSSAGGNPVTGTGTIVTATDVVSGLDLLGLSDGTLTLSVILTDASGNAASAVSNTATLDISAPTGHSVSFGAPVYSSNDVGNLSFVFDGAEIGSLYSYTISSSAGGTPVTGVNSVTTENEVVTGVNIAGLNDGTLTLAVYLSDSAGNSADVVTATASLDTVAPSLVSSSPANGVTDASLNTTLTFQFNKAMQLGTGSVQLFNARADTLIASISATDAVLNGTQVSFTSLPLLAPANTYYVLVDGNAFMDAAGNAYAGITNSSALRFSTHNELPVANPDTVTVVEDQSFPILVLLNDHDVDSDLNVASMKVVSGPANGRVSLTTSNGSLIYTPNAHFTGADSFTYTVEDVYGGISNETTVSITVMPRNNAPMAVNDLVALSPDQSVSIAVTGNDTDLDIGDTLDLDTLDLVTFPANGTAAVLGGEIRYTPDSTFTGTDSFTYTVRDSQGAMSNVATVIVNVLGSNELPVAANDAATVNEDDSVNINVLANDSDIDGELDMTSVMIMTAPQHGTAEVDALTGSVLYTPNANFHGSDNFTYVVKDDGASTSNAATVEITVVSVNDAPIANNDTVTITEHVSYRINALGNDVDLDGQLVVESISIMEVPQFGSIQMDATDGSIIYTPSAQFNGEDAFTYRVQDNEGAWSHEATVFITTRVVAEPPLANNDWVTTTEDEAISLDILANDLEISGHVDPATLVLSTPTYGTVVHHGNGTVTYHPAANFFGTDQFHYTVENNAGDVSNQATVTVRVDPVNDVPVMEGTPAASVNQGALYRFIPQASDVDPNTNLRFTIQNKPSWATFNAKTGELSGTPGNEHVGTTGNIVIVVSDGKSSTSTAAFSITVVNVNDAPEIGGSPVLSIDQDGGYRFVPVALDIDANDTLTFSVENLPYWATFNPATGEISGTPGNDDVGHYTNIIVRVSDGVTTIALDPFDITVVNVNDAPVIVADRYRLQEGGTLTVDALEGVVANDVDIDGDTLTATLVEGPRNAAEFVLNADGSFRYVHNGSETVTDSFTYRISDGLIDSDPVLVSFTIEAVNDVPQFSSTPVLMVQEGALYEYFVGLSDPDSTLTLSLVEAPEWLSLINGRLFGTAPVGEFDPANVVLRAEDGQYTVDQSFTLTVLEKTASGVVINTHWTGVPALLGNTADLTITLTHVTGPAVTNATLNVTLQGLQVETSMKDCVSHSSSYSCDVALAEGETRSYRLRVTPSEGGNVIVVMGLEAQGEVLAQAITDVSTAYRTVSHGNNNFALAQSTSLASINLLNDGIRELVAGTLQGDTVKLLNFHLETNNVEVIGEIANLGYNEQVLVADVDLDGLDDIILVNSSGDASAVYYDRGGEFQQESSSQVLPYARQAVLADLNNDGYPELILGGNGNNLYVYENQAGIYEQAPLVLNSPESILHFALFEPSTTAQLLAGTLVMSTRDAVQLVSFSRNPDAINPSPAPLLLKARTQLFSAHAHAQALNAHAKVGPDNSVGDFTLLSELPLAGVSSLRLADLDDDGREEIIVGLEHVNYSADNSGVMVISVSNQNQLQQLKHQKGASVRHMELGDFNGDNLVDLLIINDNSSYQFYLSAGTGSSWASSEWMLSDTILYHDTDVIIAEDINANGLTDVLAYEKNKAAVEIYLFERSNSVGLTNDLEFKASVKSTGAAQYHFDFIGEITNHGPSDARNVVATIALPEAVSVLTLPNHCIHDAAGTQVICRIASIPSDTTQKVVLSLVGDREITQSSIAAHAVSDELELNQADNRAEVKLSGLFGPTRTKIKGGGSLDYGWIVGLLGVAALSRRRLAARSKTGSAPSSPCSIQETSPMLKKAAAVMVPISALLLPWSEPSQAEASSGDNSYLEVALGSVSSRWSSHQFQQDLATNAQGATLLAHDDSRLGFQVVYGYRLLPNLAIELGLLDSGQTELEVEADASNIAALGEVLKRHAPVSGQGPYAGIRLGVQTEKNMEFYVRTGIWSWSAGYALQAGEQSEWISRGSEDWLWGAGFNLPISTKLRAGGILQQVSLDGNGMRFIGLNLQYQFDVQRSK